MFYTSLTLCLQKVYQKEEKHKLCLAGKQKGPSAQANIFLSQLNQNQAKKDGLIMSQVATNIAPIRPPLPITECEG